MKLKPCGLCSCFVWRGPVCRSVCRRNWLREPIGRLTLLRNHSPNRPRSLNHRECDHRFDDIRLRRGRRRCRSSQEGCGDDVGGTPVAVMEHTTFGDAESISAASVNRLGLVRRSATCSARGRAPPAASSHRARRIEPPNCATSMRLDRDRLLRAHPQRLRHRPAQILQA